MVKSTADIKKEFDLFAGKIARLESLRRELYSLNTKGFEKEVASLESKLHDVNAIPEITQQIAALREKIKKREMPKISHKYPSVNLTSLKKKISELEKQINKRRKLSNNPSLSKEQILSLKEIPKLERALQTLQKAFAVHTSSAKVKIDSGVGVLVDRTFADFIANIRAELTERLREKEKSMDEQLRADLGTREELFAEKYQSLVKQLQEQYQQRVHDELHRELHEKVDGEIGKRLAIEKRKLLHSMLKQQAQKLEQERRELIRRLQAQYSFKERQAAIKADVGLQDIMRKLGTERAGVKSRQIALAEQEELLNQKKQALVKQMRRERRLLEQQRAHIEEREKSIGEIVSRKVKNKEKALKQQLFAEAEVLKQKLAVERAQLHARFQTLQEKEEAAREAQRSLQEQARHQRQVLENEVARLEKSRQRAVESARTQYARKLAEQKARSEAEIIGLKKREHLLGEKEGNMKLVFVREKASLQAQLRELESTEENMLQRIKDHYHTKERSEKQKHKLELRKMLEQQKARIKRQKEALGEQMRERDNEIKKRLSELEKNESQFRKYEKASKSSIALEKAALGKQFAQLLMQENKAAEQAKKQASINLEKQKQENALHFKQKLEELKAKMQAEVKQTVVEKLRKHEQEYQRQLAGRESQLRVKLEREYHDKLHAALDKQQGALAKKKAELEKHILDRAKKLFS